jgi:hypothetical protein
MYVPLLGSYSSSTRVRKSNKPLQYPIDNGDVCMYVLLVANS